jgi:hypothetical protein
MNQSVFRVVIVALAMTVASAAFAQSGHGRGGREGREGRLSPDERKALRHDIVQHGRDHYRGPPAPHRAVMPTGSPGGAPGGRADGEHPGGRRHGRQ